MIDRRPNAATGRLDLVNDPVPPPPPPDPTPHTPNPFLGIVFECCRTYGRIYRNASGTAYQGHCPRCRGQLRVPIGADGQASRFFRAS